MFDESLLREQADRCVRLVALSLLADAQKAGDRLMRVSQELRDADAGSDDALHDFRVAVRRLRSWTGAFKPLLRGAVSRKQRRGLSGMRAASDFDGMATKLTRRLNVHRSAVLTRERPSRFGAILAERLLKESESLRGHLAAIHHATDVEESHRARIAAKRLRYVVEPVSELDGDGKAIVETLKTLQDSLGDLHDVHVFSD